MAQTTVQSQQEMDKKKICIPSIQYPLRQLSRFETIMNIAELTHGLKDLPRDLANWIEADVHSREFSYYGFIQAPQCVESVKRIIGINGYYLKLTTQNTGVNFIWHDRARNEFQFWGGYHNCIRAMKEVHYRICKYADGVNSTKRLAEIKESNVEIMQTLLGKMSTVNRMKAIEEPIIFENDIHPNPSVCYEAICNVDANGGWQVIADKKYP